MHDQEEEEDQKLYTTCVCMCVCVRASVCPSVCLSACLCRSNGTVAVEGLANIPGLARCIVLS